MSNTMQILVLIGTFVFVIYVLLRIHKLKIKMEDAIFWIFFTVVVAVLGTIPQVTYWLSAVLGIQSPVNLVYLMIIGLLVEKLFTLSANLSILEEKVTILSAEVAIRGRDAAHSRDELKQDITEIKQKTGIKESDEDSEDEGIRSSVGNHTGI